MQTSADLLSRMKQLHPLMIDLSLERIERLLADLDHPERALPPVIHIAGTNGKGSTLAFLKAMLAAAGSRVCAYSSPHLVRFHERICVPDETGKCAPIEETALVDVLARTLGANDGAPITFFEITTAAAFLAFKDAQADVALLEVGLGGRYDTTNVVKTPALTLITPVSLDHMDKLGDTLAKIAFEKAGILKPGVPAIIAQQPQEALEVIEKIANDVGAPLKIWGRDFDAFEQNGRLVFQSEDQLMDLPLPALQGRHQIRNAGLAIAALQHLHRGTGPAKTAPRQTVSAPRQTVSEDAIAVGLTTVSWPARLQRLSNGPLVASLRENSELWLDGGHNAAAGQALAQAVADLEERSPKPLVLITGMMQGKDAHGFLAPFKGLATRITAVPIARALNDLGDEARRAGALADLARDMGFCADSMQNLAQGVATAQARADGPVRIVICGSLYLAGQALALGLAEGENIYSNGAE